MIIFVKSIRVPPPVFFTFKKKMQENLEQRYTLNFCVKLGKTTKESKDIVRICIRTPHNFVQVPADCGHMFRFPFTFLPAPHLHDSETRIYSSDIKIKKFFLLIIIDFFLNFYRQLTIFRPLFAISGFPFALSANVMYEGEHS